MQIFQIQLNQVGEITGLPDSQRLFGFLMSLVDKKENIDDFAKNILEGKECCMVSNVMPLGYYPMPKDYIMEKLEECFQSNQKKIKELEENRKQVKIGIEELVKKVNNILEEQRQKEREIKQVEEEIKRLNALQESNGNQAGDNFKNAIAIQENKKKDMDIKVKSLKDEKKEYNKQIDKLTPKYNTISQGIAELSRKEIYEAIKKIDFIQKEDLEKLLTDISDLGKNDDQVWEAKKLKEYDSIKKNQNFIQKFHLKSQTEKWPGLPNIAYSLPILSLRKAGKEKGQIEEKKIFCFYVAVEENSILAIKLQNMSREEKLSLPCFLGSKASSGYNAYELAKVVRVEDIQELNIKVKKESAIPNEKKKFLNLGMLLPDEESLDWQSSILEISSSDRKPYEINDETSKVISFIIAGSVIVRDDKQNAEYKIGKCIKNQYNPLYRNALIFGNSFLVELGGGL